MDNKDKSIKHAVHDLNSLFTKILNSIQLLKNNVDKSNKNFLLINSIETNIYLATEIVEELISKRKEINNYHLVNINSVIKEVVNSFPQIKSKNVKFNLSLAEDLKLIKGKYSDYFRTIMNLVTNSYDAIEKEGEISISTSNFANEVLIEIKDNGIGIEEKNISNIFKEDFSTKEKNNSGIGLSIVKNIIDKYGGRIFVESKIHQGTIFKIFLKSEELSNKKNTLNKKILIAEDENILRELLTELFSSYDFNVTSAHDGKEFLEKLSTNNFDILIVDKNIPTINGLDCIKQIRDNGNNVPIILASGSLIESDNDVINLVNKIILKPYNFDELLKAVNELIN